MSPLRLVFLLCLVAAGLGGCADKNDSGVRLHRKPDLTGVTPGTPVARIEGWKKPVTKQALTAGGPAGAEEWIYEWDLPGDGVNNRMFTSIVVKDGLVVGYTEDSADKWRRNPQLHMLAKLDSALEDVAKLNATAARQQRAAFLQVNQDPAVPAETWALLMERSQSIAPDHTLLASLAPQEEPSEEAPARLAEASPVPAATAAPPASEPAAPALSGGALIAAEAPPAPAPQLAPRKTLRQLEAEELRIRRDSSLTRKERLRQLHEIWRQQREVMGQTAG